MGPNIINKWEYAQQKVLEVIVDDGKWDLFVRQVSLREHLNLNEELYNYRERAKKDSNCLNLLTSYYVSCSMLQICDTCNYNNHHRRGQRKYALRLRFDCQLDQNKERDKPPEWLDTENNLCSKFYTHF